MISKDRIKQLNQLNNHIIMISIDALTSTDAIHLQQLPHFKMLFEQGTYIKKVVSVLPTLTYPCHVSLITGTYPATHQIVDNRRFNPAKGSREWYFYDQDIAVPTFYSLAKDQGWTVGSIFWPVTAGAAIDYNCPPIWPTKKGQHQTMLSLRYGSPLFLLEINRRFGKLRQGRAYPALDEFATASACFLITKRAPNLLLLSLTELDHWRHKYGRDSIQALESLKRMDERLGRLMKAEQDAGLDATYVIIGDHGFADTHTNVDFNRIFIDHGFLNEPSSEAVTSWKVLAHSRGGSVKIYFQNEDQGLMRAVSDLLDQLRQSGQYGIADIFNQPEAQERGLAGAFRFIVTAQEGYHFSSDFAPQQIMSMTEYNKNQSYQEVATHGFDPYLPGLQTMTILCGKGIKQGEVLGEANIVDIIPTIAHQLGWKMPSAEGRVLKEVIDK